MTNPMVCPYGEWLEGHYTCVKCGHTHIVRRE